MGTNDFVDPRSLIEERYKEALKELISRHHDRSVLGTLRFRLERSRLRRWYFGSLASRLVKW